MLIPLSKNATSTVQILDVGINKPFNDYHRRQMQERQLDNVSETKVTRNLCSKSIAALFKNPMSRRIDDCRFFNFLP
jgi:hypothetical protein